MTDVTQREHEPEQREAVGNQVVLRVGHRDAEQHVPKIGDAERGERRSRSG